MAANVEDAQAATLLAVSPGEIARLKTLKALRESEKSLVALNPEVEDPEGLRAEVKALRARVADLEEMAKANHKFTSRRLSALEDRKPPASEKTAGYLDALAEHLLKISERGQAGITYAQAAKFLCITKARVCQMRGMIASDSRFNLTWHPSRKNLKIISLKKNNSRRIV